MQVNIFSEKTNRLLLYGRPIRFGKIEHVQSRFIHAMVLPDCPVPVRILHHLESMKYYEIPDSQMTEFRAVCDPEYRGTLYTDREFAEARPGQQVRVVHGTFKGLQGKLVRYKNRSYVVVVLATLGVFVHIPKWYCERIL